MARLSADSWRRLATDLFAAAGLDQEKASTVARLLVLTDMMGRHTHGLAQCGAYLSELAGGGMTKTGEPVIVRDTGPTFVWDGCYLPGLWLMDRAMSVALERAKTHGVVTFAMRQSHHIGCLAALAKRAVDAGCYAMLASSGPHTKVVAPFGGKRGLFSPNPFAIAIPTSTHPVLFDGSASITTVSMTREKAAAGESFEQPWLLDHEGRPTCDPAVMERAENPGSLMLLGGLDAGHKGFGLALMVEALTQGLSGHGRLDQPTRWGASVYMQVIDPDAFAGRESFVAQMDFFAQQCRDNPPIAAGHPVRLPGEQADRKIREAERQGLEVPPHVIAALRQCAADLGVDCKVLDIFAYARRWTGAP